MSNAEIVSALREMQSRLSSQISGDDGSRDYEQYPTEYEWGQVSGSDGAYEDAVAGIGDLIEQIERAG